MAKTKVTKRKHVKNEGKPFACHCGTRFLKRIYLNAHIKKFHLEKKEAPSTSIISYEIEDDFDWSDPDIELLEPGREGEEEHQDISSFDSSSESSNEEDKGSDSMNKDDNTEKNIQEDSAGSSKDCADMNLTTKETTEGESGNMSEDSSSQCQEISDNKDNREVQAIYEGRMYCKPTQPMKVLAPKRKLEGNSTDSDIEEIQVSVKESMKKRLCFNLPGGKKLKVDIRLE